MKTKIGEIKYEKAARLITLTIGPVKRYCVILNSALLDEEIFSTVKMFAEKHNLNIIEVL